MKRTFKITLVMLLLIHATHHLQANAPDIQAMRNLCAMAQNDATKAAEFSAYMNLQKINTPLLSGYKAMSYMMLCKHGINPITKLSNFNKGKALLEKAIVEEPNNIELIFFRYITQRKVPLLLNYSSNKEEDKKKLTTYLLQQETNNTTNNTLYKIIKKFI
jgi:hypothetical protein